MKLIVLLMHLTFCEDRLHSEKSEIRSPVATVYEPVDFWVLKILWSLHKITELQFEIDCLRSKLSMKQKCPQQIDSSKDPQTKRPRTRMVRRSFVERQKRSVSTLLKTGSIEDGKIPALKCYPCQRSSLFITKEVSWQIKRPCRSAVQWSLSRDL